ncbi:L-seryl-tRNA(Sec) selenium transferase [Levilinea saccharolytica]|uniref:L-seryl-tRNA(Sec) selenium transferase n=1 Tax=Levilinea saccharolytica TaxID=229921 RepID=A0A0P6XWV2_9CHLR|nr:L-seryl-tRNA(Sec) selenium transferase [Levilinea saccharolytica]KPL88188.1 selenocysteine synthase [Levilinea saccharolytica]GAP17867.1 L-seryl-tRNA(Sec) selenium transferase [Levilinea saccharolytica]
MSDLRELPSVDQLLQTRTAAELVAGYGRGLTLRAIRETLAQVRIEFQAGGTIPQGTLLLERVRMRLESWLAPTLMAVINATGVVLHTNLGRAPLSREAVRAVQVVGGGYSTLEFDLPKGSRGSRSVHAEALLKLLTGAEAALVVNNNAAAVLLALSALAKGKRVVIARNQLVEIGGGFRVPDVMRQSGAKLVEVGTTNRVHLRDYEDALDGQPAAVVMRAHSSNFRIIGFTSEPEFKDIVQTAHGRGAVVLDDLGSGTFLDTARFGLAHEPTIQEAMEAGADLICFSGDKLLGGPQAGIVVGKAELVAKIKKHPLARAVRADKLCLSALSATLTHYLRDEAEREIPVWQMIGYTPEALRARALRWVEETGHGEVLSGESTVGGGSLPEETLPTYLYALAVRQPGKFLARLRKTNPPIIARIQEDRVVFDPRTVLPDQEGAFLVGLKNVLNEFKSQLNHDRSAT